MSEFHDLTFSSINSKFKNAVERGTFYYPAWKHYGSSPVDVVCDRCSRNNLVSCIGYGSNFDLCLNCVQTITETLNESTQIPNPIIDPIPPYIHPRPRLENPIPPQYTDDFRPLTRMRANLFRTGDVPLTNMEQHMFKTFMQQSMFRKQNEDGID